MGLKRRHRKKVQHFDPKRALKLDHKRKCFVVDEAPPYPIIATPRQLQKNYHYSDENDSSSDDSDDSDDSSSSEDSFVEYQLSSDNIENKHVIHICPIEEDSGFEGGGTAPAVPKHMLGRYLSMLVVLLNIVCAVCLKTSATKTFAFQNLEIAICLYCCLKWDHNYLLSPLSLSSIYESYAPY